MADWKTALAGLIGPTSQPAPKRLTGGAAPGSATRFKPGVANNPGGKFRHGPSLASYVRHRTDDGKKCIELYLQQLEDATLSPGIRQGAANALLDRGYGKAPVVIEADVNHTSVSLDFSKLSTDEINALSRLLSRAGVSQTIDGGVIEAQAEPIPARSLERSGALDAFVVELASGGDSGSSPSAGMPDSRPEPETPTKSNKPDDQRPSGNE